MEELIGPWGDAVDYLEGYGARPSRGWSGLNMVMRCPSCEKSDKLYVLVESNNEDEHPTGSWVCYHCRDDVEGMKGRGAPGFWRLYAMLEGISLVEAKREAVRVAMDGQRIGAAAHAYLREEIAAPEVEQLPAGARPCWEGAMPKYLRERNVTKAQAKRYGMTWYDAGEGGRWSGRVVFPLDDFLGRDRSGHTGRLMISDSDKPKYISTSGSGQMVFGWREAMPAIYVVLVEGPFDVLGVDRVGLPVVGVLGKAVRSSVFEALIMAGVKRVIMMLDPEALAESISQGLSYGGAFDLRVAVLPDGTDPGAAAPELILESVRKARPCRSVWADVMMKSLRGHGVT